MFGCSFIIGIFCMLLACINFMNLSTARSESEQRSGYSQNGRVIEMADHQAVFVESYVVVLLALYWHCCLYPALAFLFNDAAGKNMAMP